MKKILLMFLLVSVLLFVSGCNKKNKSEKDFLKIVTETKGYKAEGIIESYYETGKKQHDFVVYFKSPDYFKVVIKPTGSLDKQIILKNNDGVFILVPAVNRNFKIQSSWPKNASYPYLLQSLAKDIANDNELIKTREDGRIIIETKTKFHANANPIKQKIILDTETSLPKEVLVYDAKGNLHTRVIFSNIQLDYNVSNEEFDVNKSMESVRLEFGEEKITYENRTISYPNYYPAGSKLSAEDTIIIGNNNDVRSIMKFTGEVGFTVVQEYVNDTEEIVTSTHEGEIVLVFGVIGVLGKTSLYFIHEGIEYLLASNDLPYDELIKVGSSYLIPKEK